jgi:hypothetical protein
MPLLIIENRQAAEALCDTHPDIAIIWCRGQHPSRVLDLIEQAAATVCRTLIRPDADLGRIRIAARIFDRLPDAITRTVIDVGAVEHPKEKDSDPSPFNNYRPTLRDRTDQVTSHVPA